MVIEYNPQTRTGSILPEDWERALPFSANHIVNGHVIKKGMRVVFDVGPVGGQDAAVNVQPYRREPASIPSTIGMNPFRPNAVISEPDEFKGRVKELSRAGHRMLAATNFAIVGQRGIGKSSLAQQVQRLAEGNHSLLPKLGMTLPRRIKKLTLSFSCTPRTARLGNILVELLAALPAWSVQPPINLSALSADDYSTLKINFIRDLSHAIAEGGYDGACIFIDEIQEVKPDSDVSEFIKIITESRKDVSFVLSGVNRDGIAPMARVVETIKLQPMSLEEVYETIDAALGRTGGVTIATLARERLAIASEGHPLRLHKLGSYAFNARELNREGLYVITLPNVLSAIEMWLDEEQYDSESPVSRYRAQLDSLGEGASVVKRVLAVITESSLGFANRKYLRDRVIRPMGARPADLDAAIERLTREKILTCSGDEGRDRDGVVFRFADQMFLEFVRCSWHLRQRGLQSHDGPLVTR